MNTTTATTTTATELHRLATTYAQAVRDLYSLEADALEAAARALVPAFDADGNELGEPQHRADDAIESFEPAISDANDDACAAAVPLEAALDALGIQLDGPGLGCDGCWDARVSIGDEVTLAYAGWVAPLEDFKRVVDAAR